MRVATLLLAALLLALSVVHALPVRSDAGSVVFGAEDIEVAETTTATSEQFTTKVHRVEANAAGVVTRDVRITLVVDVTTDGSVTLNGAPLPVGPSTQTVAAVLFPSDAPVTATVTIDVTVANVRTPFGQGRVFDISERITELDGERVFETGMRQWTVITRMYGRAFKLASAFAKFNDAMPVRIPVDGVVGAFPPMDPSSGRFEISDEPVGAVRTDKDAPRPIETYYAYSDFDGGDDDVVRTGETPADMAVDPMPPTDEFEGGEDQVPPPSNGRCSWYRRTMHHVRRVLHALHIEFNRLPLFLRLVISFCVGAFSGYVLLKLLICVSGGGCCKGGACSNAKATGTYDANLQAYALQYTALPADEKDALKKEEKETLVV